MPPFVWPFQTISRPSSRACGSGKGDGWNCWSRGGNGAQHVTCDLSRSDCSSTTPTSSAMSFARIVGLQPRILVAATRHTPANLFLARRLISTSTCAHAEHNLQSNPNEKLRPVHPSATQYDAQSLEEDPYKRGPSAIDKAVHLFFLTEIFRGIPSG